MSQYLPLIVLGSIVITLWLGTSWLSAVTSKDFVTKHCDLLTGIAFSPYIFPVILIPLATSSIFTERTSVYILMSCAIPPSFATVAAGLLAHHYKPSYSTLQVVNMLLVPFSIFMAYMTYHWFL